MATEEQFNQFISHMDEIWAHKEAVASSVLMDLKDTIKKVGADINILQKDMDKLDRALDDAVIKIRNDMDLKHQAVDYELKGHDRRLSFAEKMLFSTAGTILLAVVAALIATVLK